MKAKRLKPIKVETIIKRMVSFYAIFMTVGLSLYSISDNLIDIKKEHTMYLDEIQYSSRPVAQNEFVIDTLTVTVDETVWNAMWTDAPRAILSSETLDDKIVETTPEVVSEPIETVETVVEEVEPEPVVVVEDFHHENWNANTSIKSSSGLKPAQVDGILSGTMLEGLGNVIIDVENTYGINAFYTMSVAALESGYGSSYMARNDNNLFGMMGCSYDSYSESVYAFGRLMDSYENKRGLDMTPNGINPTYCELDSWAGKIVTLMNQFTNEANCNY